MTTFLSEKDYKVVITMNIIKILIQQPNKTN